MPEAAERHRFMERDIDEELVWSLHCDKPSLDRVRRLVADGADVNACDKDGSSILMHAVRDRRVPGAIVEFLVRQGANVMALNSDGDSVLMAALWNRRLERETVGLLVARGADVNAVNRRGHSVLMQAVSDKRLSREVIRCLIDLGADINATHSDGDTVLKCAAFSGRLDAIELLVEHGACLDMEDEGLLFTACMDGGPEVVAFLLSKGLNPNTLLGPGETVLGAVEAMHESLQGSAGDDREFALECAARLHEVRRVLLDAGAARAWRVRASRLGTWLHVTGRCPTGLYTNAGCLSVHCLPNISEELCDRFQAWLESFWSLWAARDGNEFPDTVNDFEKEQNRREGLELATEIKHLVGPAIEVTHSSCRADSEATHGRREELHEIK